MEHHRDLIPVGTVCRIRQWEDMKAEFGVNAWGSIPCDASFTKEMRYLCGRTFTVSGVHKSGSASGYALYRSAEGAEDTYMISGDMLEFIFHEDANEEELSESECDISALLFG